ncbi:TrkH family potassium uptake protein [Psychroserpens sp.]|uniref:TrkH family potassium uptake protein n=1 Tax=Psychroserpens sp. TaxID=2020870 RepID=UPI003C786E65
MLQKIKDLLRKYALEKKLFSPQKNLLYGFFSYIVLGSVLLSIPFFQKQSASLLDHIFIATSAVSTTGLVTISIFDTYTFLGQLIIMVLIQLGGIGYLTFTTFVILSTTHKITNWHKKVISTEFTLPKTIKIKDFLKSVVIFTLAMEVIGAVLFFIAFTNNGMPTLEALLSSVFHSISAFCTAGFSLFNNSFVDYADNGFVNFIISLLAIAGSLGFIVITDLGLRIKNTSHKLSFTTKIIFCGFLILLSLGTGFFYFLEPSIASLSSDARFLTAFFQSMTSMTTVGFNTVNLGSFSQAMLLVCIFLMYIGASPSGTAGGIKITTFTTVFAVLGSRLKGKKEVTFLNKKIPEKRISIATSAFIFYTVIIAVGTFVIALTNNFSLENIIFEVASALGTVGLSKGITSDLNTFGKLVVIILMFIGRLGVVTFGLAVWAKSMNEDDDIDDCEEEDIAV